MQIHQLYLCITYLRKPAHTINTTTDKNKTCIVQSALYQIDTTLERKENIYNKGTYHTPTFPSFLYPSNSKNRFHQDVVLHQSRPISKRLQLHLHSAVIGLPDITLVWRGRREGVFDAEAGGWTVSAVVAVGGDGDGAGCNVEGGDGAVEDEVEGFGLGGVDWFDG